MNNFDNEGSNVLTAKTRAPPNLMDIDIDPTVASTTALQGDSVDFRGLIVSKTSQTDFRELLLARLRENPPFGNLSQPLTPCSYVLILIKPSASSGSLSVSSVATSL